MTMEQKEQKFPVLNVDWEELTDESLMPYGQHMGKKMANVPAKDLIWLAENNRCNKAVRAYITANWNVLCKQAGRDPKRPLSGDGGRIDYAPRARSMNGRKIGG